MTVTVLYTAESWATWAGIDQADAREDIIAYLTSHIADLPGIAQTDAVLRWRLVHPTEPAHRPNADCWPNDREEGF